MKISNNRFFPRGIKAGEPIAKQGIIDGLIKMANAIEKLNVENGRIEWSNDVPRIVFNPPTQTNPDQP